MPALDDYAVNPQHIEQGVVALKKRQSKLMLLALSSVSLLITSFAVLYLQQDLVYSFFGLSHQVQQLHMPLSVDANLASLGQSNDYFNSLFSWFGWLILKLLVSFIGAFFVVGFLKKFHFFYLRFQSFVLKFVGWLLAFIVLWSGLTYVQYDLKDDDADAHQQVIHYDKNIQESEMARYLATADLAQPVKAYLLAQTALLHQPADQAAAIPYVLQLLQAEKQPNFINYGFQPEQIWAMQHQVYGKSLSPMAQQVEPQVAKAEQLNAIVHVIVITFIAIFAVSSAIFWLLASNLKKRALRIEHKLLN